VPGQIQNDVEKPGKPTMERKIENCKPLSRQTTGPSSSKKPGEGKKTPEHTRDPGISKTKGRDTRPKRGGVSQSKGNYLAPKVIQPKSE